MTVGGVVGWLSLSNAQAAIPYVLTMAAASFIYIAVADLVPELHHHRTPRDMFFQLSLMSLGLSVVSIAKALEQLGAS
jgi:zinc and cadmium transporter